MISSTTGFFILCTTCGSTTPNWGFIKCLSVSVSVQHLQRVSKKHVRFSGVAEHYLPISALHRIQCVVVRSTCDSVTACSGWLMEFRNALLNAILQYSYDLMLEEVEAKWSGGNRAIIHLLFPVYQ